MKKIVAGVDGSKGSEQALHLAVALAKHNGGTVQAVTAWHIATLAYGGPGITLPVDVSAFEENAEETSRKAVDRVAAEAEGVRIERLVHEGPAARVLLDAAREADLLVVGSRGLGGFTGLLLGSVSQQCAQHASCPVLIAPDSERASEVDRDEAEAGS